MFRAKDVVHERDKMVQNLAETERFEFKKSFELYREILLRVLTKVGLNIVLFGQTKLSDRNPRVHLSSIKPFFYQPS